jgi:hypothetical protein
LNHVLPKGAKVLCVGEAEVFEARFPVVYNTVFDKSIFQEWLAASERGKKEGELPLKPINEIRARLHEQGITHIYVSWREIRRYRAPGSYGYTDFVTPARFEQLVQAGVLGPPVSLGPMSIDGMSESEISRLQSSPQLGTRQTVDGRTVIVTRLIGKLTDEDRESLKEFGRWLLTKSDDHDIVINEQLFRVR